MSFDVYLQVFDKSNPAGISRDSVRDAFGTAVSESEPGRWGVFYDAQNSPGCKAPLVANFNVRQHLPHDLIEALGEPVVIGSGAEILREIQAA